MVGCRPTRNRLRRPLGCGSLYGHEPRQHGFRRLQGVRRRYRRGGCGAAQHRLAHHRDLAEIGVRRRAVADRLFRQCRRYRRRGRAGAVHRRGRVEGHRRADDGQVRHDRHRLRRDERQRRNLRRRAADLDGQLHRGRGRRCRYPRRDRDRARRRRPTGRDLDFGRRDCAAEGRDARFRPGSGWRSGWRRSTGSSPAAI